MYKIESIKFFDTSNIITITIINNNLRFSIDFYKQKNRTFINFYHSLTNQLSNFLIEDGFVTRHRHHKYKYMLQLTPKTLLSVL